jgi:hypothetical protein
MEPFSLETHAAWRKLHSWWGWRWEKRNHVSVFVLLCFFFLRKKVEMDIEWGTYSVCCIWVYILFNSMLEIYFYNFYY